MSYIERESLKERIQSLQVSIFCEFGGEPDLYKQYYGGLCGALRMVDDMPTADVVEVVRCKECKHWKDEFEFCDIHDLDGIGDGLFGGDAFCNEGERRTDDET